MLFVGAGVVSVLGLLKLALRVVRDCAFMAALKVLQPVLDTQIRCEGARRRRRRTTNSDPR